MPKHPYCSNVWRSLPALDVKVKSLSCVPTKRIWTTSTLHLAQQSEGSCQLQPRLRHHVRHPSSAPTAQEHWSLELACEENPEARTPSPGSITSPSGSPPCYSWLAMIEEVVFSGLNLGLTLQSTEPRERGSCPSKGPIK